MSDRVLTGQNDESNFQTDQYKLKKLTDRSYFHTIFLISYFLSPQRKLIIDIKSTVARMAIKIEVRLNELSRRALLKLQQFPKLAFYHEKNCFCSTNSQVRRRTTEHIGGPTKSVIG